MKNTFKFYGLILVVVFLGWQGIKGMEDVKSVAEIKAMFAEAMKPKIVEGDAQRRVREMVESRGGWHAGTESDFSVNGLAEWLGSKRRERSNTIMIKSKLRQAYGTSIIPSITQYRQDTRLSGKPQIGARIITYGDIPNEVFPRLADCAIEDFSSSFFWFVHILRSQIATTSSTQLDTPLQGLNQDFFEQMYQDCLKNAYLLMKNILESDKADHPNPVTARNNLRKIFKKHIEENVLGLAGAFFIQNDNRGDFQAKVAFEYWGNRPNEAIVEDLQEEEIREFTFAHMICSIAYSFAEAISKAYPTLIDKQTNIGKILNYYRLYIMNVSQYKDHYSAAQRYFEAHFPTPRPPTVTTTTAAQTPPPLEIKLQQLQQAVTTLNQNLTAVSQKLTQLKTT